MPFIRADQIGNCLPGAHIRIGETVYVLMQDSKGGTDRHIKEYLFDPKNGWWGHWSRLVKGGEEMVVLMTWTPEQSLRNQVKRMLINLQSSSCVTEREAAIAALQSALPIIDAYRRVSGGDGDACAMNIRDVLRKMSPVR